MATISKLIIKACSDNKFSSSTGEFITAINPEDLKIMSGVKYNTDQGMGSKNLLWYAGSSPRLLSFKLFFDNTGAIAGSDSKVSVMDQLEKLQAITYDIQDKIKAPNYIRVIWGKIDFKGRLVDLEITYSLFKTDGTLIRAQANIEVLEEQAPVYKGSNAASSERKGEELGKNKVQTTDISTADVTSGPPMGSNGVVAGPVVGGAMGGVVAGGAATASGPQSPGRVVGGSSAGVTGSNPAGGATGSSPGGAEVGKSDGKEVASGGGQVKKEALDSDGMYKTKAGDSTPSLAKRKLGDPNAAKALATRNGLNSLRALKPGVNLKVPSGLLGAVGGLVSGGALALLIKKIISKGKEYGEKGAQIVKNK